MSRTGVGDRENAYRVYVWCAYVREGWFELRIGVQWVLYDLPCVSYLTRILLQEPPYTKTK